MITIDEHPDMIVFNTNIHTGIPVTITFKDNGQPLVNEHEVGIKLGIASPEIIEVSQMLWEKVKEVYDEHI